MSDVMESAGRILPMPKLDYDASKTFYMLDIVNHNSATWICRKECTGQEPSDTNTEYWQRFGGDNAKTLDGHGAEYFATAEVSGKVNLTEPILEKALSITVDGDYNFKLGGSNYTGIDLPHAEYAYGQATIKVRGGNGTHNNTTVILWGTKTADARSIATNHYNGTSWAGWQIEFTTDGGTIDGAVTLTNGVMVKKAYVAPIVADNTNADVSYTAYLGKGDLLGYLGMYGVNNPMFTKADGTRNSLFHTGNKPTGTYTGNGDATQRTISTGGIGHCIVVSSPKGSVLVRVGASGSYNGEAVNFTASEAICSNGNLKIATTDVSLNESGVIYNYEVI